MKKLLFLLISISLLGCSTTKQGNYNFSPYMYNYKDKKYMNMADTAIISKFTSNKI